jgi:hypothetical protein
MFDEGFKNAFYALSILPVELSHYQRVEAILARSSRNPTGNWGHPVDLIVVHVTKFKGTAAVLAVTDLLPRPVFAYGS